MAEKLSKTKKGGNKAGEAPQPRAAKLPPKPGAPRRNAAQFGQMEGTESTYFKRA